MNPNRRQESGRRTAGAIHLETILALALTAAVLLPISGIVVTQRRMASDLARHLMMIELVDGEMELIASGDWVRFSEGTHSIPLPSPEGFVPPVGELTLERHGREFRLTWRPTNRWIGGGIERRWTAAGLKP
jgi:hypothetical protein